MNIASVWQKIMLFLGRKEAWAKVVFEAAKMETKFEEVKKTSPFADKVVVAVSYDNGGTSFYGDIYLLTIASGGLDIASSVVKNAIRSKAWVAHDCDDYMLSFRRDTGAVEIFWIGCGSAEVKSRY